MKVPAELTMRLAGFRFESPMPLDPEYLLSWVRAMTPDESIVELAWSDQTTFASASMSIRLGRRDVTDQIRVEVALEPGITAIYLGALPLPEGIAR